MNVILEAIKFNHVPDSATADAFNIRRNETEFVTVPEWRQRVASSPERSPAAYAIKQIGQNVITIKAKLRCPNPTVKGIEVQAVNISGDSCNLHDAEPTVASSIIPPPPSHDEVLGWIYPQQVDFLKNDEDGFVTLTLKDSKISEAGVGTHMIHWEWQFREGPHNSWKTFGKTCHQIYTVLKVPRRPWLQRPYAEDNKQLPWTDVLDYACHWAEHTHNSDDAAARVTQSVRDLERVFYITYDPTPFYSRPNFDCSGFLKLITDGIGKGSRLNCSDCATVVSTFANILGCALWQSSMDMAGTTNTFLTNPIRLFGRTCWRGTRFVTHEVAWKGRCTEHDSLFDATVELDGDDRPSNPPQRPLLPRNIRFGGFRDRKYLFRFFSSSNSGTLEPRPRSRKHRSIRPTPNAKVKPSSPELLELIEALYEFKNWPNAISANNIFLTPEFLENDLAEEKSFLGLDFLVWPQIVKTANLPPVIQMLLRSIDDLIRIDINVCKSNDEARNIMLQEMSYFETPTLQRHTDLDIGEIAFREPETGALLFLRSNLVGLVRNAGPTPVDPKNFALRLDRLFLALLAQKNP